MKKLRKKISGRISQSEIPIIVYFVVFLSIFLLWRFRSFNEDIAFDFIAELFGVAFTLFIIDTLLVRSKRKRWKVVRDEVNYLIARNINRIRDGISTRAFIFDASLKDAGNAEEMLNEIRKQRAELLKEIGGLNQEEVIRRIEEASFFNENNYEYFSEKAAELWDIMNIRYADYIPPELASILISLNVHLKDLCSHIRQYLKSGIFSEQADKYKELGVSGASVSIKEIIKLLNRLKEEGCSEAAPIESVRNQI